MKKLLSTILALVFIPAMITGCTPPAASENSASTDSSAPAATVPAESGTSARPELTAGEAVKVGVTLMNTDSEWQSSMADYIEEHLKANGYEPILVSGNSDSSTQIEQIENFAVMGCDVIVCQLVNPLGATSVIKQVREQGIKIVSIVFTPEEYDGLIRADQYGCGKSVAELAADWVNKRFPDAPDGSIECAIISSSGNDDAIERSKGLYYIEEICPKVKIVVDQEPANINSSEASMAVAENIYLTNPNLKLVLCYNSANALGVNNYLVSTESPVSDLSEIGIFGNDIAEEVATAIRNSVDNKAVVRGVNVINGGTEGVAKRVNFVVTGLLDGSLPSGYIYYSETDKVTPENIDDFA